MRSRADFFEAAVALAKGDEGQRAKTVANWINGDFARLLHAAGQDIQDSKMTPEALSELLDLQANGTISGKTAKSVFEEMFEAGRRAGEIVEGAGLGQMTSGGRDRRRCDDRDPAAPETGGGLPPGQGGGDQVSGRAGDAGDAGTGET